jgi:hypothetical protein
MMAVEVRGAMGKGLSVGLAFVNTSFHTLGLCEFEDTADFKNLEAVTVQVRNAVPVISILFHQFDFTSCSILWTKVISPTCMRVFHSRRHAYPLYGWKSHPTPSCH